MQSGVPVLSIVELSCVSQFVILQTRKKKRKLFPPQCLVLGYWPVRCHLVVLKRLCLSQIFGGGDLTVDAKYIDLLTILNEIPWFWFNRSR